MTPIAGGKRCPFSSTGYCPEWLQVISSILWEHSHSIRATCHPFCAKYRSLLLVQPLLSMFPGVSSSTFQFSLLSLSPSLDPAEVPRYCSTAPLSPGQRSSFDDRQIVADDVSWTQPLVELAGSQNGKRLEVYFFRNHHEIFSCLYICSACLPVFLFPTFYSRSLALFIVRPLLSFVRRVTLPSSERNIRPKNTRRRRDAIVPEIGGLTTETIRQLIFTWTIPGMFSSSNREIRENSWPYGIRSLNERMNSTFFLSTGILPFLSEDKGF